MPSIWENFDHVFEVFQGLFFAFLLLRKDALGTRLLVLGCLILQISHKSNLSFNSKNLPTVRLFSLAFSPFASKVALKKMLESPEKII